MPTFGDQNSQELLCADAEGFLKRRVDNIRRHDLERAMVTGRQHHQRADWPRTGHQHALGK